MRNYLLFSPVLAVTLILSAQAKATNPTLQLSTANPTDGLSGRYVDGDLELRFETARTNRPKGGAYDGEQLERDYDIAIRLLNKHGHTFYTLTEGHHPEHWSVDSKNPAAPIEQATYFLARSAAAEVKDLKMPPEVQGEQILLAQLLRSLGMREKQHTIDATRLRLSEQAAKLRKTGAFVPLHFQGIASYWKPAFFQGSPCDHTATVTMKLIQTTDAPPAEAEWET